MTPEEYMKKNNITQSELGAKFGIAQQTVSEKLSRKKPWKPHEALLWEKISGNEVTRDAVLFPDDTRKASGG